MTDEDAESPTVAEIDKAIRDYVSADLPGGALVTGWCVVAVSTVPGDLDSTAYTYLADDQPLHVSIGLLELARRRVRRISEEMFDEDE